MRARAKAGSHALPDAEYVELLARQGGGCAICGTTPKTRRLHTDRDHRTLQVRGLLCMRCNRALPAWVTLEWLLRAALYLIGRSSVRAANGLRSLVIALYEEVP